MNAAEENQTRGGGPLAGIRIVEFAAIGPAPFGVMLLADLGAEVLRIERAAAQWPDVPIVSRGRASIFLDLKSDAGLQVARDAIAQADVVVEGYRPGVMERLGLGPEDSRQRNERLIYARMTGWGQDGPLASRAGHDINYIGLVGMLDMLGPEDAVPVAPLNLLGDYGGGGLYLALGIVAALVERQTSGLGQVVDASILDGAASMLAPILGMQAARLLPERPGDGMLGGGYPYYRAYRCKDGRNIAVGPLEPQFRKLLTDRLGLKTDALDGDPANGSAILERKFATRTRDEWGEIFAGLDACVTPILTAAEAADHPHLRERGTFERIGGTLSPAPAPRFSRTPGAARLADDATALMRRWGVHT